MTSWNVKPNSRAKTPHSSGRLPSISGAGSVGREGRVVHGTAPGMAPGMAPRCGTGGRFGCLGVGESGIVPGAGGATQPAPKGAAALRSPGAKEVGGAEAMGRAVAETMGDGKGAGRLACCRREVDAEDRPSAMTTAREGTGGPTGEAVTARLAGLGAAAGARGGCRGWWGWRGGGGQTGEPRWSLESHAAASGTPLWYSSSSLGTWLGSRLGLGLGLGIGIGLEIGLGIGLGVG